MAKACTPNYQGDWDRGTNSSRSILATVQVQVQPGQLSETLSQNWKGAGVVAHWFSTCSVQSPILKENGKVLRTWFYEEKNSMKYQEPYGERKPMKPHWHSPLCSVLTCNGPKPRPVGQQTVWRGTTNTVLPLPLHSAEAWVCNKWGRSMAVFQWNCLWKNLAPGLWEWLRC